MCGFLGAISYDIINKEQVINANDSIVCRGPDNKQLLNFNLKDINFSLVFNRLSILDLSHTANQPMESVTTKNVVMFNGEIYNHLELRKNLESKGIKFKTDHSDTEVILNGLDSEGTNFISKLRGQFAIFYLDKKNNKFYLIRDRLGQKPLYFYFNGKKVLFSSSLKPIKEMVKTSKIVEKEIYNYIKYGIISSPSTLFQDFYKVLPSEIIEFTFKNDKFELSNKIYWKSIDYVDEKNFQDDSFFEIFSESVKLRQVADVPVANFLSGGVDSTSIVKIMHDLGLKINTFTVKQNNSKYDESNFAKEVSQKYSTNHTEVNLSSEIDFNIINLAIESLDEPFSDPSIVPSYLIANEISKYYKVAISGDGGDELLGGYKRINLALSSKNSLQNFISQFYRLYPPFLGTGAKLMNLSKNNWKRYSVFIEDIKLLDLLNINSFETDKFQELHNSTGSYKDLLLADYKVYLSEMMMYKVDRTSMINSLEVRSPFVDHKLVEYILSCDIENMCKAHPKAILKNNLLNDFDSSFVNREKRGFVFDLQSWVFKNENYFFDSISQSNLNSLLNLNKLKLLKLNKSNINAQRIWKLYILSRFI